MPVTLVIIGNNFINGIPRSLEYDDNTLFSMAIKDDIPVISTLIFDNYKNKIVEVKFNEVLYCNEKLTKRVNNRHIVIENSNKQIIFELRYPDPKTIIIGGLFYYEQLFITQNYILLPSGKRIMYNKISSNLDRLIIDENGMSKA